MPKSDHPIREFRKDFGIRERESSWAYQNQSLRLAIERSGQRDPLSLTSAQGDPFLSDFGLIASREDVQVGLKGASGNDRVVPTREYAPQVRTRPC